MREKVLIAREFLGALTKLPSDYCRKDSLKLYLESVILLHAHICAKCFKSTAIPKENSEFYSRK